MYKFQNLKLKIMEGTKILKKKKMLHYLNYIWGCSELTVYIVFSVYFLVKKLNSFVWVKNGISDLFI